MSNWRKDHLGASSVEPLPVVIIGNGPSGICLSYLLSGYTPYVKPDVAHPHPLLQRKLTEAPGVSVLDQVGQSSGHGAGDTATLGKQGKKKKTRLLDARPNEEREWPHSQARKL